MVVVVVVAVVVDGVATSLTPETLVAAPAPPAAPFCVDFHFSFHDVGASLISSLRLCPLNSNSFELNYI